MIRKTGTDGGLVGGGWQRVKEGGGRGLTGEEGGDYVGDAVEEEEFRDDEGLD